MELTGNTMRDLMWERNSDGLSICFGDCMFLDALLALPRPRFASYHTLTSAILALAFLVLPLPLSSRLEEWS